MTRELLGRGENGIGRRGGGIDIHTRHDAITRGRSRSSHGGAHTAAASAKQNIQHINFLSKIR